MNISHQIFSSCETPRRSCQFLNWEDKTLYIFTCFYLGRIVFSPQLGWIIEIRSSCIIKFKTQWKDRNWEEGYCLSKIPKIPLTIKWKSFMPLLSFSYLSLTFSLFSHLFISGIKLNDLPIIFLQEYER